VDDILVLAPTRWKLRRAIAVLNQTLGSIGLLKRPEKTNIGRIERGFDFWATISCAGRCGFTSSSEWRPLAPSVWMLT
jgi:hypothetical protein